MRFLPRRVRFACGRAAGRLVYTLDAKHRAITFDNVDRAFGSEKTRDEKERIARGSYEHFGAMLLELITLGRESPESIERRVELVGAEHVERAKAKGKGVIMVTGHFGNWELHGIAHGFRFGPIHVVARPLDNPYFNALLERLRRISGNGVIYKKNALMPIRRLLGKGETVALVIDQNVHLEDATFVDFFGRKAATTSVPARLACRTGSMIVPAFCYPLPDGRYRAVYEEPIDGDAYRGVERSVAVREITQTLAHVQEKHVRENPRMWLWMHRRWRTRPPAEEQASASMRSRSEVATVSELQ